MKSEDPQSIFDNYLLVANRYLDYFESEPTGDKQNFLSKIQCALIDLYRYGRVLPEVSSSGIEFDISFKRNDKQIQSMIEQKVPFSAYWHTIDPFSLDQPEVGLGDLLDDLGDIYLDLKRAVLVFNSNVDGAKEESFWKFKFDFDYHVADHCISAMKAIHDYMGKDGYNGW